MNYEYSKIIVGSSLAALMTSFIEGVPIFYTRPYQPQKFEYLDLRLDLSFLNLSTNRRQLKTFNDTKIVGLQKLILWERLLFLQSIRGLVPLANLCKTIRHHENKIICSNEYSKIMDVKFSECWFYGDTGTSGFFEKTKFDSTTYLCYDYIAFNSGGKHDIDFIDTGDDFVSKIWFYSSDRIDGNTPIRDACAVSKLTESQLLDFDYSETMARFKTIDVMKKNGMRGKPNGYTKNGTPRHYDFRTTSICRETRSITSEAKAVSDSIKIKACNEENLLKSLKSNLGPHNRLLEFLNENSS